MKLALLEFVAIVNEAGVKVTERGMIEVNDHLQTNVPNIYAIGDVVRGASDRVGRSAGIANRVG